MGRRTKFPGNREDFASGPLGSAKEGGFAGFSAKFPMLEQGISGARAGSGTDQSVNVIIGSTVFASGYRGIHCHTTVAILASLFGSSSVGQAKHVRSPCRRADWTDRHR